MSKLVLPLRLMAIAATISALAAYGIKQLPTTVAAGEGSYPANAPAAADGQYLHRPPTIADLRADDGIHPELKAAILRGRDLFNNTQVLRGKHVFNDMSCRSCHPGEGRNPWSGPVWPAATTFPDYRGKNRHVNTLEERIAGCFSYSMNGIPPGARSDEMIALIAYHRWLATGAPMYERRIYGRGFRHLGTEIPEATSRERGASLYAERCAVCHGADGEGQTGSSAWLSPPLWGDDAYNWGSGMSRIFTAAAFIHLNMPFGQVGTLSAQDAWDLAFFINGHERPQDPRYEDSAERTRQRYLDFHRHTLYGTTVDGRVLGAHRNTGSKPILRPASIRPRRDDVAGGDEAEEK